MHGGATEREAAGARADVGSDRGSGLLPRSAPSAGGHEKRTGRGYTVIFDRGTILLTCSLGSERAAVAGRNLRGHHARAGERRRDDGIRVRLDTVRTVRYGTVQRRFR